VVVQVHAACARVMVDQLASGGLGTVLVFAAHLRAFGRPCSEARNADLEERRIALRSFAPAIGAGIWQMRFAPLGASDSFRKPLGMHDPGTIEVLCSWRKVVKPDF
jgi:hypothetical protein